jgi:hypothetical protein
LASLAHPPHHRGDQLPADLYALAAQQVAQHPAARERIVHMQYVDPAHDRKFCRWDRPSLIVQTGAAEPQ